MWHLFTENTTWGQIKHLGIINHYIKEISQNINPNSYILQEESYVLFKTSIQELRNSDQVWQIFSQSNKEKNRNLLMELIAIKALKINPQAYHRQEQKTTKSSCKYTDKKEINKRKNNGMN